MQSAEITGIDRVAEIRVTYSHKVKPQDRPQVTTSKQAADMFLSVWPEDINYRESFFCMYLNRKNRVIGIMMHSTGTTNSCLADVKMIFGTALKANAAALIVAHNHPSGCPEPSRNDIELTEKLKQSGVLLDCPLLDHIILIDPENSSTIQFYHSFADSDKL